MAEIDESAQKLEEERKRVLGRLLNFIKYRSYNIIIVIYNFIHMIYQFY